MKTKARTEDFSNIVTTPHGKSDVVLSDKVYCPKSSFREHPCSGIWCGEDIRKWPVEPGTVTRTARCQRLMWSAKKCCRLARGAESRKQGYIVLCRCVSPHLELGLGSSGIFNTVVHCTM